MTGKKEAVGLLLTNGANRHKKDINNKTALQLANNKTIIELLQNKKLDNKNKELNSLFLLFSYFSYY